jgi:hypothetical protein
MTNRYARILAAGGAAVLAVTLGIPAALAAGSWSIQPGGSVQAKAGTVRITDTTTATMLTCPRWSPVLSGPVSFAPIGGGGNLLKSRPAGSGGPGAAEAPRAFRGQPQQAGHG